MKENLKKTNRKFEGLTKPHELVFKIIFIEIFACTAGVYWRFLLVLFHNADSNKFQQK